MEAPAFGLRSASNGRSRLPHIMRDQIRLEAMVGKLGENVNRKPTALFINVEHSQPHRTLTILVKRMIRFRKTTVCAILRRLGCLLNPLDKLWCDSTNDPEAFSATYTRTPGNRVHSFMGSQQDLAALTQPRRIVTYSPSRCSGAVPPNHGYRIEVRHQ